MEELKQLLKNSKLFLDNIFFLIRNEIDFECEQMIFNNKSDTNLINDLNQQRDCLLKSLDIHRSSLFELYDKNKSAIDQLLKEYYEKRLSLFENGADLEDAESDLFKLKRVLLSNKTFIYCKQSEFKRVGQLIIVDASFKNNEIELIKEINKDIITTLNANLMPLTQADFRFTVLVKKLKAIEKKELNDESNEINYPLMIIELVLVKYLIDQSKSSRQLVIYLKREHILETLTNLKELNYDHSNVDRINQVTDCFLKDIMNSINIKLDPNVTLFDQFKNLEVLSLNDNKFNKIDQSMFAGLDNLKSLILEKNELTELEDDCLKYLSGLRELNIVSNELSDIKSNAFSNLVNLKKLDLSENKLKDLEENLFSNQKYLEELSIGSNLLKEFKSTGNQIFIQLTNLTYLYMGDNYIEKLNDAKLFEPLTNLKILALCYNRLKEIDSNVFAGLKNLSELYLQGNCMENFNSSLFDELKSLKILILSENKLTYINDELFKCLKSLETLDVSENKLETLHENSFSNLNNLRALNLKKNQLEHLNSNIFNNLSQMTNLDLANNKFSTFKDYQSPSSNLFKNLVNLNLLNVSCNLMEIFNINDFIHLKNLKKLIIYNNLFHERDAEPEFNKLKTALTNLERIQSTRNVM